MTHLAIPAALLVALTGAPGRSPLLTDRFSGYERGGAFSLAWHELSGEWRVEDGRLVGRSPARGLCWTGAAPISADQQASVRITPVRRVGEGGWAAAALLVWLGESDFWRLAVVEGPDARHYAELLEMRDGVWQAQSEGPARLELSPGALDGFEWAFGRTYRFRLDLTPTGVLGEITDDLTGDLLFRRGHPFPPGADAVRRGRPALMVDAMEAAFDDLQVEGVAEAPAPRGGQAAILETGLPDASPEVIALLRAALAAEGLEARVLPAGADEVSIPDEVGLLLLPHTRRLPPGVLPALDRYLRRGGNAIFLGGPLGEETVVRVADRWLPLPEALAATPTERVAVAFSAEELSAWRRDHGPADHDATLELHPPGPAGAGAALSVRVADLRSWNTLGRDFPHTPFGQDQTLTCLWAKGGPRTSHLTIEWQETDGSRWMTAVALSPEWRRFVLAPGDFAYWADSPAVGRGGPQDRFHPERASRLALGLTKSHSPLPDGSHAYWVAEIGTARAPFPLAAQPPPIIEAVSPAYKTFPPAGVRELATDGEQTLLDSAFRLPSPPGLRCALPRSRGLGLKAMRPGRWVPLVIARGPDGVERGCAASLYLSLSEPYPDAAWGVLGVEDARFLTTHRSEVSSLIGRMARRLTDAIYLVKGGSDQFGYLPGERPLIGAQVLNRSPQAHDLTLRASVSPADRPAVLFRRTWPLNAAPGALVAVSDEWSDAVEPGLYRVQIELLRGNVCLDAVSQELVRLPAPQADPAEFVAVRDGDFVVNGKPWRPHGINYWPSNATGLEPPSYWLHWLHPGNYDPAVIRRDLQALSALKINSVSILLGDREQLPAGLHFLHLCRRYGLRANVFVGGGDPVGFNVQRARELIAAGRLAENPAIWAWDIAWEPHFGDYERRRALDPHWSAWIAERYGSVPAAENDWGSPVPRTPAGEVTGPSQEQILNDGEHRAMVAAYRRFLDDLVSNSYGRWAREVKAADPRHLIGVRSGYGGTGQPGVDGQMPFDLAGGAKHLDFISPEGYGLGGPWESFEQGGFTTEYARHAGAGKPVFWAEFGLSVHPDYTPERFEAQRQLYEHLYRMVLWSGAGGSAGWWFPGGFRVGENSDYGIMGPDGAPRPSALEVRRWADRVARSRPPGAPEAWITIDRDLHPRGYSQVWLSGRDEYVRLRRQGRRVGLRTAGTGTDSTNTPLVAVGNTACNGANPPKYLNAEFNLVRIRAGGEWLDVGPGATVRVPARRRVELFAALGNTGEARWVAPARAGSRPGGVFLVAGPDSALPVDSALRDDVPRFGDATFGPFTLAEELTRETSVALRLEARGRTPFGACYAFTLAPE
ncbi:MAG: hypothetical protein FJX74_06550 [Armatimonadetes bacterium]|nr:hypothetical protein [Armatimonadota bacterium]